MIGLLAGATAIGFAPLFVRWSEAGPIATAFWRISLALPLLVLWSSRLPPTGPSSGSRQRLTLLVAGLFFAADLALWHWSIRLTSIANATLFANFASIVVVLYGWLAGGERITPRFVMAMIVALGGTVLVVGAGVQFTARGMVGDALGLATAVAYAGYILAVKRARGTLPTGTIMAWSGLWSAVALGAATAVSGESWLPASTRGWWALAGLALISHVAGQSLIAWALAHLRASFSSLALLIQPVVATIAAWHFLGEHLSAWQILGGGAVLAGVALARTTQK